MLASEVYFRGKNLNIFSFDCISAISILLIPQVLFVLELIEVSFI